ncbi:hypothetical protein MBAV_001430 [Candidatus Magnetobacterium bavaricum]|uniref:Uncharacterized protein n=1 Tax=Candidatus Magnetobacterium bavaricum TaxID=29290 RepID=A0A0F3GWU9_9BACT|nr:hypothetical protein MBAV_001430 [Candidatus Magnetobacterium bavaricum]
MVIPSGTFSNYWIETKPVTKDSGGNYVASDYVMSQDIGNDILTGTPMKAGYHWKKQYPIAIISPTKCLLRVVNNTVQVYGPRKNTITVHVVSRYYGLYDNNYLHVESTGVFGYYIHDESATVDEELRIGVDILESFSYTETRIVYPVETIDAWMCPIVVSKGA